MSRIVRTETGTTRRRRLMQGIAQTLRAFSQLPAPGQEQTRQMLAFLALALAQLQESVEETATAWEKRSYWVKADRFRRDWAWASRLRAAMDRALEVSDLDGAAACGMELATAIAAQRLKPGRPIPGLWNGAWNAWQAAREGRP